MNNGNPVRRRDMRVSFDDSTATIELAPGSGVPARGRLLDLSVAGLALELDENLLDLEQDMVLPAVVRVGECDLHGSVLITNVRPRARGSVHAGCLFYPDGPAAEYALMALLTGLEKRG